MRVRRRIAVTVAKCEILISSNTPVREPSHCERCGRDVSMLPAALAAGLAGVTERLVYQWVEAGKVHFLERPNGAILICPESLGEFLTKARGIDLKNGMRIL
jgi:hypothetical protein